MMGYSTQSKGYKLWDAYARKFVVSQDVTFNESSNNKSFDTADKITSTGIIADSVIKDEPTTASNDDTPDFEVEPPSVHPSGPASDEGIPSCTDPPAASVAVPTPRPSERITRKPGPWWITTKPSSYSNSPPTPDVSLLGTCCDSPTEVALLPPKIPTTYTMMQQLSVT